MAGSATSSPNSLVVPGRPDTSLNVQLHPLVLLTISDYITRHTLRQQSGPVIGAIIGQQNGRDFTLEHAYECKLAEQNNGVVLDGEWFGERLEMYKEVHKAPALDLVAMFMLGPVEGPRPDHLPVLKQVRDLFGSDSIMLLLFNPDQVDHLTGGKLPISLYETVDEVENDQVQIRFKELAFEVETGDAEMIGVNSVATGGGNATAVPKVEAPLPGATATASSSKDVKKVKGKGKAKDTSEEAETNGTAAANTNILSPEDDELISTLNSKVNAIKMLNERLNLIRSYLETLPQSSLTDPSSTTNPAEATNYTLLRSVKAMLSRLPLLAPPTPSSQPSSETGPTPSQAPNLQQAGKKEKQDVHLTNLLASLTRAVSEANNLGSKFHILQREKQNKERVPYGGRGGGGGGGVGRVGPLGDEGLMTDNGAY